jgi:hypothetical protein
MMLDAAPPAAPTPPPAPDSGTSLPLPRPTIADLPEPLPPVDVEGVMVGCGWQPELRLGKLANPTPQLPIADAPERDGPDAIQAPEPGLKRWTLHTSSVLALSRTPVRTAISDYEMPAPIDAEPSAAESKTGELPEIAVVLVAPAAVPEPVPPAPITVAPVPVAAEPTDATEVPAEAAAASPTCTTVVLARPTRSPHPIIRYSQAPAPDPEQEAPDQPSRTLPELPAAAAPRASAAVAAAPARPEISIPPELARQVAQLIRPSVAEASPPTSQVTAPVDQSAPTPHAAAAAPAPAAPASIPAPSSPVDLGRSEWMQAMIDRIGDIVQADGRREAQIKLLPSALGAVEVIIVQRDEQMHVTLTSENAQARQLLSDAAPRLQELAEARGLRFAQADIGGGQPQDRRTPSEQHNQTPLRPRSAAPEQGAQDQPNGDLIA